MVVAAFFCLFDEARIRNLSSHPNRLREEDTAFVYDDRTDTLFLVDHHSAAHRELGISLLQLADPLIHPHLIHGRTEVILGSHVRVYILTPMPQIPESLLVSLEAAFGGNCTVRLQPERAVAA